MESFAEYILSEDNLLSKIEIVYYLAKKTGIFFDKSVVFKTEITRQFIDYMKLDVDRNMVLTASLLCNCKKTDNAQKLGKLKTYALEGANYLSGLGFDKRFCKICEEVNRYSDSNPRQRESDILELVDQFGGMLLDRPERIGFAVDEALVLLEHRNLKDQYNRFLHSFLEYVAEVEAIQIGIKSSIKTNALRELVKIYNETEGFKEFIKVVAIQYAPTLNVKMAKHRKECTKTLLETEGHNPYRALFSEETAQKILGQIDQHDVAGINTSEE